MPIDVRGPDGTIYRVNTDDETVARDTVRRALRQQEGPRNRPRSSNPTGRRPNANTISPGNATFSRAYARERQRQEAVPRASGLGWTDQAFRNMGVGDELAEAAAFIGQGSENIGRRLTGREIEIPVSAAVEAADRYQRNAQDRFARERPAQNALSIAATVPMLGGNPTAALPRVTALQGGAAAAGTNAPFALARQEGDTLQERLPGAAQESAVVFGMGAGLQGLANHLSRPPLTNTAAGRMADFDAAGVRAPLAAVQQRQSAPMAMAIAENPIGGNVRRNLQNSVDDVQAASQRLTQQVGTPEPREIAGEIIQRGVQRFARGNDVPQPRSGDARSIPVGEWSVGAKSRALYDRVFNRLGSDEAAMVGHVDGPLLTLDSTRSTLASIQNRVSGEASNRAMRSQMIDEMAAALEDDLANGTLRFQDLRQWRTRIREAQRNEGLRQGMDNASLQRLEAALTRDIYESALNISPGAAQELRAVDRWYRTINSRIENALERFQPGPGNPGATSYRRAIDLARQGGQQNTRALRQLRASLRPDEWRTFAATVADELGNPNFGNPTIMEPGAFSIENFVRNYATLSAEGRAALFGAQTRDFDRLARAAGNLKGVRGFANASRSGSSLQNIGTLGTAGTAFVAAGTGNVVPLAGLAAAGLLARITGEMLTNPGFVRWLTSANAGGMRRQLQALSVLAARDPALAPLYTDLAQAVSEQVRPQPDQGAPRSAQEQRRTAPVQ